MLMKLEFITNKQLKRFMEHSIYLAIVLILIPAFLFFELCIVLPLVVEEWTLEHIIHLGNSAFLVHNIIGNMIYGMFTNTSIKGKVLESFDKEKWPMCTVCQCLRPPRTWHCNTCDICILKRDHHCTFLACCVGYFNHRYFICFTFYIFVSMMYALYFNLKFLSRFVSWNHGWVFVKFFFPFANFVIDFSEESVYIFLVVINFLVGIFTGFLFFYHFNNILKGTIVPETKISKESIHNNGWKSNIIEVFGSRWYITWISPFISSPLPGNGMEWNIATKYK